MVSALWTASSEGDVERVKELLNDIAQNDLEIKDEAGNTPLIEAVKNGHVEVVGLLLEKGADPTNASAQGPPEQHTSDPAILELLSSAKNKIAPTSAVTEQGYPQDPTGDVAKGYYPPPGPYYYPVPPPMLPDGSVGYYPPPPPPPHHIPDHSGSGFHNLPPPEIARMIPCRYFPACRYGASCMFLHPGQGPYMQGPMPPPGQYPAPYDPMNPAAYPPYYPPPTSAYPSPPNGPPMNPVSPTVPNGVPPPNPPPPPMMHARTGSDMAPPPVQGPFTPGGIPPPVPYGVPPAYGHPAPIPIPIPSHSPVAGPRSPQQGMYPATSPTAMFSGPSQYGVPPMGGHPYPPPPIMTNGNPNDPTVSPKSPIHHSSHPDPYGPPYKETYGHHRRGSARRPSFGMARKPPCLFFPSGRCKNGDECRFPHVLDGPLPPPPPHYASRGGHRPRPSIHTNGVSGLEEKFATLTTQDSEQYVMQPAVNGINGINGGNSNGSSRSQSTEPGARGRGHGYRSHPIPNGHRSDRKGVPPRPQRLPSADEFPVLAGSSTPPLRSPGAGSANGWAGPTAAQVLQAPAPSRKDSQPGTRGASPANGRPNQPPAKEDSKAEVNGTTVPHAPVVHKLPISFAAVAAPEAAKEVAIAA